MYSTSCVVPVALIQRRCNSPLTALIIQGTALRERNRGLPIYRAGKCSLIASSKKRMNFFAWVWVTYTSSHC
ncbi:hypothetical protein ALQ59_101494 [Pseudomonas syringae pv. apii]|uniref:Uncharacterized protein n=1 Tax=Pseudomonas syringae pv. apii TaxID=81036 RepID=A0A3M3MG71_9PSED|nr:hypothetical protein ALQ58_101320 [Pseudomonas syringae pv. apii]RMN47149.1 hypothetical protein ALQ59_101494 [Pseudomonas syringae pv. apii]RMN94406.1 hypothetical protein ALQ49_101100 [Pseudomonas syringae pv. apii]